MKLAQRTLSIKPAILQAVTSKANKFKAQGHDVIGLGVGEPDFDTPRHIKDAAIQAINSGFTKYTAIDGTPSLKQAVINKFKRDNNLDYSPKQIIVSCGGKHSFFNIVQATIDPGDEVIIPAPYWASFPDIVALAGGVPVIIQTGIAQAFKMSAAQLEQTITPKTRMLILNSPSNPTGAIYSHDDLAELGEVLVRHPQVLIVSDDMYEHILFDGRPFVNILNACPGLYGQTVVMNAVSKSYAMTGWRIGYAAGPENIIAAMVNVQSQSTSNPTSIAQFAAEAALNGDQSCILPMVKAFKERHDFVVPYLKGISGIRCLPSGGAFYAFADVREAIHRLHEMKWLKNADDDSFCNFILETAKVSVVPGSAFGTDGYMRISFATSMENLRDAMHRIRQAIEHCCLTPNARTEAEGMPAN
jgi:aspartate aminotransferase